MSLTVQDKKKKTIVPFFFLEKWFIAEYVAREFIFREPLTGRRSLQQLDQRTGFVQGEEILWCRFC